MVVILSFASNGGEVDELTAKFCGITLIETLFETPDKHEFTEHVAVYEMSDVGETEIELPVPAPFDHVTVPAQPVAESVVLPPEQIINLLAEVVGMFGVAVTVTAMVRAVLFPHELTAETLNVPDVAVGEKLTVTLLVVPVMVAPVPE